MCINSSRVFFDKALGKSGSRYWVGQGRRSRRRGGGDSELGR